MSLHALERETVVSFNDAEEMALVFTHQRRVITALKKNPAAVLLEEGVFETTRWARFAFPKSLISFRKKRRTLDDAERSLRAARLAAAHNGHAGGDYVDTSRRTSTASRDANTESIERSKSRTSTPVDASSEGAGGMDASGREGDLV